MKPERKNTKRKYISPSVKLTKVDTEISMILMSFPGNGNGDGPPNGWPGGGNGGGNGNGNGNGNGWP